MMITSTPTLLVTPSDHPLSDAQRAERMTNPSFGRIFTDHMVVIPYRNGAWQQGELKAYGPLSLDPAASALHYGQAILKALKPLASRMAVSKPSDRMPTAHASTAAHSAWQCRICLEIYSCKQQML